MRTNVPFYKQEFYGIMSVALLNGLCAEAREEAAERFLLRFG